MLVENRFQLKNLCHSVYQTVQRRYNPKLPQSIIRELIARHFGYKSYSALCHGLPTDMDLSLASATQFLQDLAGPHKRLKLDAEMLFQGIIPNGLHQSPDVFRFCSGCGTTLPRTAMRKEIVGDYFHHTGQVTSWYCPCGYFIEAKKAADPDALFKYLNEVMIPDMLERNRKERAAEMGGFKDGYEPTQDDLDNYSDQLNPNNDAYWNSRGEDGRPDDWEDRIDEDHDDEKKE